MNRLTDKIGIDIKDNMFFVDHISEDGKTSSVCYSDSILDENKSKMGMLEQLLLARAWFVCTSTADVLYDPKIYEGKERYTLNLINDLSEALVSLGGEKYENYSLFSGELIKEINIKIEDKIYTCKCEIKWKTKVYEQEMPSIYFYPKFSWWSKEEENKNLYTNKPLFKKLIEFGVIDSENWAKILNGRDFNKFLEDMIKKYN